MSRFQRVTLSLSAVMVMLHCGATVADVAPGPQVKLAIAAQSLDQALNDWSEQTGFQVLILPEGGVSQVMAPKVEGSLTPEAALRQLLATSGLAYTFVDARTVSVHVPGAKKSATTSMAEGPQEGLRLARANQADAAQVASGDSTQRVATAADASDDIARPRTLDEVVVTGTHIRGTDVVGSQLIVLDRDYIEKTGYGSIEDVLKTLPQMAPAPSEDFREGPAIGNTVSPGNLGRGTGVNLRGLGTGATLVLVNGFRQATTGVTGRFVDVSNIPLAAVDRIEILPDGGATQYGSDAIGGVVNIILRKDYRGFETQLRFGTLDGDADETRASQIYGSTWSTGRFLVGYEYYKRDSLETSEREYTRNGDQRRNGGDDYNDNSSVPGNILFGLRFAPGPDNLTQQFGIPGGQDGTTLTPAELLPALNRHNANDGIDLLTRHHRHSGFLDFTQQLNDRIELATTVRFSRQPLETQSVGTGATLAVPSSNPFFVDPYGDADMVFVDYRFPNTTFDGQTDTTSATLETKIALARDWQVRAAGGHVRNEMEYHSATVDFVAISERLFDVDPTTALNVFGDELDAASLSRITRNLTSQVTSTTSTADVTLDGPIIELPGGLGRLAIGGQYQQQKLSTSDVIECPCIGLERSNRSAFTELMLPFVGVSNARPGLRELRVSLAARQEHYSTWGNSALLPRFGIDWAPASSLKFRGTWGKSFKAPPMVDTDSERFFPHGLFVETVPDPLSPTETANALILDGANPALREERGMQWTLGFEFTPSFAPKLSLSLSYFDNEYQDRVGSPGTRGSSNILLEEELWPGLVNRNPTAGEIETLCNTFFPEFAADCIAFGPTLIIDGRLHNLAVTHVRGLDFRAGHSLDTARGIFDFGVNSSFVFENEFSFADDAPPIEVLDTVGNGLSLRVRATAGWAYRGFSTHMAVNHAPSYDDKIGGLSAIPRSVNSWTTFDMGLRYQTEDGLGWLGNTTFSVNVVNAFDEDPPFVNQAIGYDPANADPYGRVLSLEIGKGW